MKCPPKRSAPAPRSCGHMIKPDAAFWPIPDTGRRFRCPRATPPAWVLLIASLERTASAPRSAMLVIAPPRQVRDRREPTPRNTARATAPAARHTRSAHGNHFRHPAFFHAMKGDRHERHPRLPTRRPHRRHHHPLHDPRFLTPDKPRPTLLRQGAAHLAFKTPNREENGGRFDHTPASTDHKINYCGKRDVINSSN